jgi:hypothetical protein
VWVGITGSRCSSCCIVSTVSPYTCDTSTGEDSRSNTVATVSASAVVVIIEFSVFDLLFAIFLTNPSSLCITMLILSVSLKIMQIGSVGL